MSRKSSKSRKSGFTLIEMLIVIGLLGALTALILPALSANREEAIGDICDYNQAGTVRVLHQYRSLIGLYPSDLHNGLDGTAATAVAMDGIPEAQSYNMTGEDPLDMDGDAATDDGIGPTRVALTANMADSLTAAGITNVCSGTGLNSTAVATGVNLVELTDAWLDDTPAAYQFDGQSLAAWRAKTNSGTSDGVIVVLWVAPTVNWAAGDGSNTDWTKGNVQLGIDLEGQCPIPTGGIDGDPEFAYYMGYFLVDTEAAPDNSPAQLIGTSCPECGVMNP
jgi:prepilin-type N-terminal cleavage/methylation domain-containing protein